MIRHKATGTELKWRPTLDDYAEVGACALDVLGVSNCPVAFFYPPSTSFESTIYPAAYFVSCFTGYVGSKEELLAKAVELGVVEVIDEDPPKDYDAIHRVDEIDQAIDDHNRLLEDARALAIRLFLAGHDDAASALRRLL